MDIPFEIFRTPATMRARIEDLRRDGRRIAVVPTMGALHEGHLSLLREARGRADIVIVTIFVNPTQFGPNEDLARYPRDEAGDLAKARTCGVDLAFCPDAAAMYPAGAQTFIEVRELQKPLCGASRPGHFAGVATVVAKLFHATLPHVAVFGEKDYQQLAIIRRMVRDLDFPIEIASVPIVREADGLALSSRNAYLSADQRRSALSLSAGLAAAEAAFAAGERRADALVAAARAPIEAAAGTRIDYVELRDADELTPITRVERPAVLALAVFVGTTRLIDNRVLAPKRAG
ncbi:MAG TPA: pantoate--beta-alanine ligase [Kofleriaceae bacterium]|nr:pantoate--beta-alanine ligase [Kofleriaceae bacterium]